MRGLVRFGAALGLSLFFLAGSALAELPDPVSFSWAVESNNVKKVTAWLDEGLDPDFMSKPLGTGLMIAAWNGNIPMMELFVARGANPRRANENGEQPLQLAAWNGHAEAVRWLPGGTAFLWTSEGDFTRGFGPQLRASRWGDGTALRDYALPESFTPAPRERQGPRANGTLEGLALAPGGQTAWLAMELPWWQDGPLATHERPGGPVRITAIDVESGQALRQIAYQPDALPHAPRLPLVAPVLGVSEILADGEHHLLVLERAYSLGHGFHVRLYRIDTRQGNDTLGLAALQPGNHRVPPKTLVADFAQLALPSVDNIEGMTWGPELPELPGGGCVLVFVSDNNFNPAQRTQFIAAHYQGMGDGEGHCSAPRSQP